MLIANMFQRGDKLLKNRKTVDFDREGQTTRLRAGKRATLRSATAIKENDGRLEETAQS